MPMKLGQEHKDWIYEQSRKELIEIFEHDGAPPKSMGNICFQWSFAVTRLLREFGITAQLQAGTCIWSILDAGQFNPKDEAQPTEFGYVFDADKAALEIQLTGHAPEIHCWVAYSEFSIIDMTVGEWPAHIEATIGLKWLGEPPPKYLWIDDWREYKSKHRVMIYRAEREAIEVAKAIQRKMGMYL